MLMNRKTFIYVAETTADAPH